MISYRIVSNKNTQNSRSRNSASTLSKDEQALERALSKNRFKVGNRAKIRGTPLKGTVKAVLEGINDIPWVSGLPQFLVVAVDDGSFRHYHPSKLKGPINE